MLRNLLFALLAVFIFSGCSKDSGSSSAPSSCVSPVTAGATEKVYCPYLPSRTFSGGVTVTGSAKYFPRLIDPQLPGGGGLGDESSTGLPIRFAEVRITDKSAGTLVQCDETDSSGNFSFQVPNNGKTYTVEVVARGSNSKVRASVLDAPSTKKTYAVSGEFVASGSPSLTLNARATSSSVISGAFNIFDQIVETNEFLRAQVGSGLCSTSGCDEFSVAPKIEAYWRLGYNPGCAFESAVSFYLPGYSRLFILGGIDGDYNSSDTDHFDNSIIVHEYAHFLEDVLSVSDSPGGSHDGDSIIDPRLAWSEGFANFLQAAVRNAAGELDAQGSDISDWYIDTEGNSSGTTSFLFKVPIERSRDTDALFFFSGMDRPISAGEGAFREFAVTRLLWDAYDGLDNDDEDTASAGAGTNTALTDDIDSKFSEIWTVFTSATDGFNKSNVAFRHQALLTELQDSLFPASDWTNLRNSERTLAARTHYALPISTGGTCSADPNYSITLATNPSTDWTETNMFYEGDFYEYSHPGGTLQISLTQTGAANLDLYVFKKDYVFGDLSTVVVASTSGTSSETATKTSLAAGRYLIGVLAVDSTSINNFPGDSASYNLRVGGTTGTRLCP